METQITQIFQKKKEKNLLTRIHPSSAFAKATADYGEQISQITLILKLGQRQENWGRKDVGQAIKNTFCIDSFSYSFLFESSIML